MNLPAFYTTSQDEVIATEERENSLISKYVHGQLSSVRYLSFTYPHAWSVPRPLDVKVRPNSDADKIYETEV